MSRYSRRSNSRLRQQRKLRLVAHFAIGLAIISLRSAIANAQPIAGTYVAGFDNGVAAIFASDSRAYVDDTYSDTYCKIIPLSHDRMFVALGAIGASGEGAFNADEIAKSINGDPEGKNGVRESAGEWEAKIQEAFNISGHLHRDYYIAHQKEKGDIVTGVFAGVKSGEVVIYIANIKIADLSDDPLRFVGTVEKVTANPDRPFFTFGQVALHSEFLENISDRARRANEALRLNPATGIAADAAKVEAIVKFVIRWSGDKYIGGSVPVLILERNGIRWFRRPDFCEQ